MLAAWGVYRLDRAGAPRWLCDALLVLVGYGPVLYAVAFTAIVVHGRGQESRWEKTVKTGKAILPR